jgi:Beta-galactosidase
MGEHLSTSRNLFRSFLQAGVECSTHINTRGDRLDLLESTRHSCFAQGDFERLQRLGIRTVRSAVRWHLIERTAGTYDFSSLDWQLDAADAAGIEVVLDVLHFGVPDGVDVFARDFPNRLGAFAGALAEHLKGRGYACRCMAPVNEISFMAWAGGEKAAIGPFATGRGGELKRNLIRAAVRASDVMREVMPGLRLIAPEPAIHIVGNPEIPGDAEEAIRYTLAYFEAWDLLSGRLEPELGGGPEYLDVIGVNFYWRNEWEHNSGPIDRRDPRWRPFSRILRDIWERYRRPLFVSETGTEDDYRAEWFEYICDEVMTAMQGGVPVEGICWYPIFNHPGWDDDRHCHNGVFDYADDGGNRDVHAPLADAFLGQRERFRSKDTTSYETGQARPDLFLTPTLGICVPEASAHNEPLWP